MQKHQWQFKKKYYDFDPEKQTGNILNDLTRRAFDVLSYEPSDDKERTIQKEEFTKLIQFSQMYQDHIDYQHLAIKFTVFANATWKEGNNATCGNTTLLERLVASGNLPIIKLIIEKNFLIGNVDNILNLATKNNQNDRSMGLLVKHFISLGADVNKLNEGYSPLHLAAMGNNYDAVYYLVLHPDCNLELKSIVKNSSQMATEQLTTSTPIKLLLEVAKLWQKLVKATDKPNYEDYTADFTKIMRSHRDYVLEYLTQQLQDCVKKKQNLPDNLWFVLERLKDNVKVGVKFNTEKNIKTSPNYSMFGDALKAYNEWRQINLSYKPEANIKENNLVNYFLGITKSTHVQNSLLNSSAAATTTTTTEESAATISPKSPTG